MKNERILNNLENVDEKYIEEAAVLKKKPRPQKLIKWGSIAAGIIVILTLSFAIGATGRKNGAYFNRSEGINDTMKNEAIFKPGSDSINDTDSSDKNNNSENGYIQEQKLIKTFNLTMETKEFDRCIQTVNETVASLGGYSESFDISGRSESGSRNASAKLRIPSDKIDKARLENAFDGIATIIYSSESTDDVTLQYIDIESRLKSLRTEQDTLLRLIENASSLSDIITVQAQLTDVRYKIESYESKLRLLQNKITYSIINITIREVARESSLNPSFAEAIKEGFIENTEDVFSICTDIIIWFITSIPYFIIIIIPAAVIIIVIAAVRKRKKK